MPFPALLPTYPPFPFTIASGKGERIWDTDGNAYLDLYGGHCVCVTGHCHPTVVAAIQTQASSIIFYSTAGRLDIRERAAEALVRFAGRKATSVFFVNSGAEANENALKIARKATGRKRFVSFTGGWHGRSILGLSVTDDPKIRAGYEDLLAPAEMLPWNDLAALDAADFSDAAAVILEPVQSMAGIVMASKPFLQALRRKCDASGTVLIFDEIQTGFGRLGTPFASGYFDVDPDITTVAKGIASGVPMGAVILNEALATGIKPGDLGSTFGGGPIACAALLATLEVLVAEQLSARANAAEEKIRLGLAGSVVTSVSGAGLLLGLHVGEYAAALKKRLLDNRILVGGSHNPEVLRLLPPLTLSDEGIAEFLASVSAFSAELAA